MEFKIGDRIIVTAHVIGGRRSDAQSERDIIGKVGVIEAWSRPHSSWVVRIDGDPGFTTQNGCWHVKPGQMRVFQSTTNESALFLLNTDGDEEVG